MKEDKNFKTHTYQRQIEHILQCITFRIQENWTCKNPEDFNQALSISQLADIANMSIRNFQLIFKIYMGETVHQYITRLRMEYVQQLLKENQMNGMEISEYVGFENQSALNNTFRKKYHLTPQERQRELLQISHIYPFPISTPRIIEFKDIPVLFLSYIGNYENCNSSNFEKESWNHLYEYAKQRNLLPDEEDYWGIAYDDTDITSLDKCRFCACIAIQKYINTFPLDSIFECLNLPKGIYAVYTHKGTYSLLDAFYEAILKQLPQHYHLGETPILEHYLNSSINMHEKELITEVWVPIIR